MVSRESAIDATPREHTNDVFSIDANHSNIVKFESNTCQPYLSVSAKIIGLVETAASIVGERFESPNKSRTVRSSFLIGNLRLTNI